MDVVSTQLYDGEGSNPQTARLLDTTSILLKLDITKAFDTVDWKFLVEVLWNIGFVERLLPCICALLSNCIYRILVNGSLGFHVAHSCGLRQGDPLRLSLGIHHRTLIYAGDVLTSLRSTSKYYRAFSAIIEDFGAASMLHSNFKKCSTNLILCAGTERALVEQRLDCPMIPKATTHAAAIVRSPTAILGGQRG
jgi:hypothetical protein